jgi:hypothetical protein
LEQNLAPVEFSAWQFEHCMVSALLGMENHFVIVDVGIKCS